MTNEMDKPDVVIMLEVLEGLKTQWNDFSDRLRELIDLFEAASSESDVEAAVKQLDKTCRKYPYIAALLDLAEDKQRGASQEAPKPSPQELIQSLQMLKEQPGRSPPTKK